MKTLIHAALFSLLSFSALPALAQDAPVNINEASAEELATLPGIGEVKAQAIVDDREANGDYKSLEDLTPRRQTKTQRPQTLPERVDLCT